MRILLVLGFIFACTSTAGAQDRVLGLLALPELFGNGPCDRFSPQDVPLHATPDGAVVGRIHVVKYWTFNVEGGCEGLEVAVRQRGTSGEEPLPSEEYAYESPAAVVLEQRRAWFKLRLTRGVAWVRASRQDAFHPLEALYEGALTFLTSEWNGRMAAAPGSPGRIARVPPDMRHPSVRVLRSAHDRGELWFQIEVMSHSQCDDVSQPTVIDSGWVAAHSRSGEPSIWFSSRGC